MGKRDLAYKSIDQLTELEVAPVAGDWRLIFDTSADEWKKVDVSEGDMIFDEVTIDNLTVSSDATFAGGTITDLGTVTAGTIGTAGATVWMDETSGSVQVRSAVWPDTVVRLPERHGATLEIVGSARTITLRFNALGLGEVASRRLRFARGTASTDLILSSHGRLRRQ